MLTNSLNDREGEIMDIKDERKIEEYKRNPFINFADSTNRSQFGDLRGLTHGGCLNQIITTVLIIGILLFLSRWF